MDGNTSPGQSQSLTFGVRNMVWKCLVWPGVRDVLTTWWWDKNNNNQKEAQDTQWLPWVQETFIHCFPTIGWQAGWHFLKVHKHTSWLLVPPKENWKKKTPIKKNNNKQKIHIIFPAFFDPPTEDSSRGGLSCCDSGSSSPNFPLPTILYKIQTTCKTSKTVLTYLVSNKSIQDWRFSNIWMA